jgi:hypothetical protein
VFTTKENEKELQPKINISLEKMQQLDIFHSLIVIEGNEGAAKQ